MQIHFLSKVIKIMTPSVLKLVLIYHQYYDKNGVFFSLDMSSVSTWLHRDCMATDMDIHRRLCCELSWSLF